MNSVGVSVFEGISSGVAPINEASKHNIGLIMERERGIPDKAVRITSLQEDRTRYGGLVPTQFGAYVTRHLFNNAGVYGAVYYGVRIVDPSSAVATGTLTDGAPNSQTLTQTIPTVAGSGIKEVHNVVPANVSVGDTFSVTKGTTTISFVATAPTVANVIAGLRTAIAASVAADWTSVTATDQGTFLKIEHNTANTAFTLTLATTNDASANNILTVWAGQQGFKDPGTWGNNLVVKFYNKGNLQGLSNKYMVEVFLGGKLKETLEGSTWALLIQNANSISNYIYLEAIDLNQDIYGIQTITLAGGTYVAPVEADFAPSYVSGVPQGLACFDGVDVQMIADTEHHTATMALTGRDYCSSATRSDCIFIANLPYLASDSVIANYASLLQNDLSSFVAGYHCWVKTSSEDGNYVITPSLGCVLGAGYVRVPNMRRDQVWQPPAGTDSVFKDCIAIYPEYASQATIDQWVKFYTINPVIFKKGKGFYIASSRTFSTNQLFYSVHVRRLTNFLVKTMNDTYQFAAQRTITASLKRDLMVTATAYFRQLYSDGALENSVPFDVAFSAICDRSNNPATQPRQVLNIDLQWIPVEVAEAIVIRLNRNDGVLAATLLNNNSNA